jgi:hypothetical protein
MITGVPLRVRVAVPSGGLRGALRATYSASATGPDGQGGGEGGELRLPTGCDDGCDWILPIDLTPTDTTASVDVSVVIAYAETPPQASASLSITIEPVPEASSSVP